MIEKPEVFKTVERVLMGSDIAEFCAAYQSTLSHVQNITIWNLEVFEKKNI
jgi:hypothetical protein